MEKVVVLNCKNYDQERVNEVIHAALEYLGGIGAFVKKGQNVLLKPNMLSARDPERGVTTHPAVLEAVISEVQTTGATVRVGDSPSGAIKGLHRYWENTGFLEVCKRKNVELINFEAGGSKPCKVGSHTYHIANAVFEADVVINLPKMKTHGFTLYTGAVKNIFGTLPGFQKANFHKIFPHPAPFSQRLVEIFQCVKPVLNIMDGITAMQGNGPATGDLLEAGLVLASKDGVALDAVAAGIMGFRKDEIDVIRLAGLQGIGQANLDDIEIAGMNEIPRIEFQLPSNHLMRMVPEWLIKLVGKLIWVRPAVTKPKCVSCAICADSCPVDAIEMKDGFPVIDYNICINCLCCNESCSDGAIYQKRSWLATKIG